jgi:hypothetical protein
LIQINVLDASSPRIRCGQDSTMPRYFFHVTHKRRELDREGYELPDEHAAWKEATVTAGHILQGLHES